MATTITTNVLAKTDCIQLKEDFKKHQFALANLEMRQKMNQMKENPLSLLTQTPAEAKAALPPAVKEEQEGLLKMMEETEKTYKESNCKTELGKTIIE